MLKLVIPLALLAAVLVAALSAPGPHAAKAACVDAQRTLASTCR